jgi:hypothetical protein
MREVKVLNIIFYKFCNDVKKVDGSVELSQIQASSIELDDHRSHIRCTISSAVEGANGFDNNEKLLYVLTDDYELRLQR